jgi:hypothetical protein
MSNCGEKAASRGRLLLDGSKANVVQWQTRRTADGPCLGSCHAPLPGAHLAGVCSDVAGIQWQTRRSGSVAIRVMSERLSPAGPMAERAH